MRIHPFIIINPAVLIVLLTVSCSKKSGGPTAQDPKVRTLQQAFSLPAGMPVKDLGEVEFTDHTQKRVDFGDGKECVITPTVLPDGKVQIDFAVEVKSADGKVHRPAQLKLITRPGQQNTIPLGDTMVKLTPKLQTQL